jgi:hypothetical protein
LFADLDEAELDIGTDVFNSFAEPDIQRFREIPVISASCAQPIKDCTIMPAQIRLGGATTVDGCP